MSQSGWCAHHNIPVSVSSQSTESSCDTRYIFPALKTCCTLKDTYDICTLCSDSRDPVWQIWLASLFRKHDLWNATTRRSVPGIVHVLETMYNITSFVPVLGVYNTNGYQFAVKQAFLAKGCSQGYSQGIQNDNNNTKGIFLMNQCKGIIHIILFCHQRIHKKQLIFNGIDINCLRCYFCSI